MIERSQPMKLNLLASVLLLTCSGLLRAAAGFVFGAEDDSPPYSGLARRPAGTPNQNKGRVYEVAFTQGGGLGGLAVFRVGEDVPAIRHQWSAACEVVGTK